MFIYIYIYIYMNRIYLGRNFLVDVFFYWMCILSFTLGVTVIGVGSLRRQSSGGCRFKPHYRRVTIQEYLTLFTRLWLTEPEQANPVDSIKDVIWISVKVPEFDKHLKKAGGHIGRNVVEIAIKMKTIVRKPLMININKLRLRNLDN